MTPSKYTRMWVLGAIVLLAFGLRLHHIEVRDFDIDETWTYAHALYLNGQLSFPGINAPPIYALTEEPNNALHLVLVSLPMKILPNAVGQRLLSLAAGVISVAATARIGGRLAGQRAAILAGIIAALAVNMVNLSQVGRPYALANAAAILSLLFWLENRWGLNLMFSLCVPLLHVGAFPVVITQDILTARKVLQKQEPRWAIWMLNRITVYTGFAGVIYSTYLLQQAGRNVSTGQAVPTLVEILREMLHTIHGGFYGDGNIFTNSHEALFLAGVVLPAGTILTGRIFARRISSGLGLIGVWLAASYGSLAFMAVFSSGPIKYIHITHVGFALALLIAIALANAPRNIMVVIVAMFVTANGLALAEFYRHPYRNFSEALAGLQAIHNGNIPIYIEQTYPLWALQLNAPSEEALTLVTGMPDEPPDTYHYLKYKEDWPPPLPDGCAQEPAWRYDVFVLYTCQHSQRG